MAVCDTDQKEITIDETYCWSTDHLGRPIDIYSDPDYRMQCIGFWKENLKSYLITYDQLDAFTNYRCWVRSCLMRTSLDIEGLMANPVRHFRCTSGQI